MFHKKLTKAFTLIELLVVLMLISLLVSMVAPKGYKLLNSISNKIDKVSKKNNILLIKYKAFSLEQNFTLEDNLSINKFGLICNDKQ